jgi:hypothetical protein
MRLGSLLGVALGEAKGAALGLVHPELERPLLFRQVFGLSMFGI